MQRKQSVGIRSMVLMAACMTMVICSLSNVASARGKKNDIPFVIDREKSEQQLTAVELGSIRAEERVARAMGIPSVDPYQFQVAQLMNASSLYFEDCGRNYGDHIRRASTDKERNDRAERVAAIGRMKDQFRSYVMRGKTPKEQLELVFVGFSYIEDFQTSGSGYDFDKLNPLARPIPEAPVAEAQQEDPGVAARRVAYEDFVVRKKKVWEEIDAEIEKEDKKDAEQIEQRAEREKNRKKHERELSGSASSSVSDVSQDDTAREVDPSLQADAQCTETSKKVVEAFVRDMRRMGKLREKAAEKIYLLRKKLPQAGLTWSHRSLRWVGDKYQKVQSYIPLPLPLVGGVLAGTGVYWYYSRPKVQAARVAQDPGRLAQEVEELKRRLAYSERQEGGDRNVAEERQGLARALEERQLLLNGHKSLPLDILKSGLQIAELKAHTSTLTWAVMPGTMGLMLTFGTQMGRDSLLGIAHNTVPPYLQKQATKAWNYVALNATNQWKKYAGHTDIKLDPYGVFTILDPYAYLLSTPSMSPRMQKAVQEEANRILQGIAPGTQTKMLRGVKRVYIAEGPSGVGKSHFVDAVARELCMRGQKIIKGEAPPSVNKHVLPDLIKMARKLNEDYEAIVLLVIEEMHEALNAVRQQHATDERGVEDTLTESDKLHKSEDGVCMWGTTNRSELLPHALNTRAHIRLVPLPDMEERASIISEKIDRLSLGNPGERALLNPHLYARMAAGATPRILDTTFSTYSEGGEPLSHGSIMRSLLKTVHGVDTSTYADCSPRELGHRASYIAGQALLNLAAHDNALLAATVCDANRPPVVEADAEAANAAKANVTSSGGRVKSLADQGIVIVDNEENFHPTPHTLWSQLYVLLAGSIARHMDHDTLPYELTEKDRREADRVLELIALQGRTKEHLTKDELRDLKQAMQRIQQQAGDSVRELLQSYGHEFGLLRTGLIRWGTLYDFELNALQVENGSRLQAARKEYQGLITRGVNSAQEESVQKMIALKQANGVAS